MIDSHVHVLDPQRFAYPWLEGVPALQRPHSAQDHRAQLASDAFAGAVLVEADVAPADQVAEAQFMCALADDEANQVVAVVAAARPEHEGFAEHLKRIAHPRLAGIRRVLHVVDDDVSRGSLFRKHVGQLADHGLSFDLCVRADQLPLALQVVRAAPDTRFILDHGGNPPLATPYALPAWRDNVARLSQSANMVCKLSGLVNHLPPDANPFETLQPIVNHLLACFGWDRMLFGSDWPVCNLAHTNAATWLDLAQSLTAHLDENARRAVFATNALRGYQVNLKSKHD